jgi:hypothetical protein
MKAIVEEVMVNATTSGSIPPSKSAKSFRLVILDGAESYLFASGLAAADIPVVLAPLLPYAQTWDQRRSLTGALLANGTAIGVLLVAGVKVAIGAGGSLSEPRALGKSAGWAWRTAKVGGVKRMRMGW